MKELPGDPTYLHRVLQGKFLGSEGTTRVLTSPAAGQPLPRISSVPLEGVANSTLPSSTEHPTGLIFPLLVVEGVVLHSSPCK